MEDMTQRDLVLASMAAAGGNQYQPVQIQKLIFLFQKRALKTDIFKFIPYDYGPFDPAVYARLDELSQEGIVEIVGQPFTRERKYCLSKEGKSFAQTALDTLPDKEADYLKRLSEWVRSLSFAELVGAVYQAYPEMRENSVFRG
jgi:uncharacterized protein YwgA